MYVLVGIDVPLMMSLNQEMYAKLRARKRLRVMEEVVETTVSTLVTSEPKAASPVVSIEEITPCQKRTRASDKGKSKADSNVWDDAVIALGRAHNVITFDKLKGLSAVPSHKLVNHHIHKLVQVMVGSHLSFLKFYLCFSSIFFSCSYFVIVLPGLGRNNPYY